MTTVLSIIQVFVTIALIGVVLIQRSEGGGLGIGTSQGMGAFMSGRGTANLLTRTTAILAAIFMALSLVLALLNRGTVVGSSILDTPAPAPVSAPAGPAPAGTTPAGTAPTGTAPTGTAPTGSAPATTAPAATAPAGKSAAPATGAPAAKAPAAPPASAPASPSGPSVPTN
jgi:preprotein translocase subunit SecG